MPSHRSPEFYRQLIPQYQSIVEAIGCRVAYDSARAEGVPMPFIALFETNAIKSDLAWYVEKGLLNRKAWRAMEADALNKAYPLLQNWLETDGIGKYVRAPVVSDEARNAFHDTLPVYYGQAEQEINSAIAARSKL